MLVLGIETSCDETAVALVKEDQTILINLVSSQIKDHEPYGGVVPEVAARAHLNMLDHLIQQALAQTQVSWKDIDGIAATTGPGLIGGVIVGTMMAKALAAYHHKPFLAINHLEGHALTARLTYPLSFPYLLLLASGGHCQLLLVENVGHYELLGQTLDDAAGEAFDKTAKLLGLPYPGGPSLEKAALQGNPFRFSFPKPLCHKPGCDFSFSGLKTAVRQHVQTLHHPLSSHDISDIAASFQYTVAEVLVNRCHHALMLVKNKNVSHLVVAGGVAANQYIRQHLLTLSQTHGVTFIAPPLSLCTDNAAMIAWVGIEKLRLSQIDSLDFAPRPRWPLGSNK
jgi:N6-L-threonylcarbamoyladenine synthase